MVEIIKKKRDGKALSQIEIQEVIDGLISGAIPDYQITAFLMALYFKGMNEEETALLTDAVLRSGDLIDLSEIDGIIVDKHSTGGVGDKTSLILCPLVAAAGVPVAKMSGRGLGHTGGTIDKLEAIKGFTADLSIKEFIENVKKHNIAICGQSDNLVPADKKLYALRDVTGTVDNRALITSSIMSKKLACGANAIVIDMKVGKGTYMKTLEDAEDLGQIMINTGRNMGREIAIIISEMDQPLGHAVGNSLEVKEAVETLRGQGPKDLTNLCLTLGSHMLVLGKKTLELREAKSMLKKCIADGRAFEKFREFVIAQNGDVGMIDNPELLPLSRYSEEFVSGQSGYIRELNAMEIGKVSALLGAGRATKSSEIDLGAGIVLTKKIGDYVNKGELLATMYSNQVASFEKARIHLDRAYKYSSSTPVTRPIIIKTMR